LLSFRQRAMTRRSFRREHCRSGVGTRRDLHALGVREHEAQGDQVPRQRLDRQGVQAGEVGLCGFLPGITAREIVESSRREGL